MDTSPEQIAESTRQTLTVAPMGRRFGACLLDSGLALLVIYLGSLLLTYLVGHASPGFVGVYLAAYQVCVLSWVLYRDAWWRGQGIGKRVGGILLVVSRSQHPAGALRCISRQAIFIFIASGLYLPVYLHVFQSPAIIGQAFASAFVSAAAPVRLLMFLLPNQKAAGEMIFAHMLVLGFVLLETLMVYSRKDGRRIVDLLAGTQVVDAKALLRSSQAP
jgi:hypothetical protein